MRVMLVSIDDVGTHQAPGSGELTSSLAGPLAVAFDLAAMGPVRTPVGGREDMCKMCRRPNVSVGAFRSAPIRRTWIPSPMRLDLFMSCYWASRPSVSIGRFITTLGK